MTEAVPARPPATLEAGLFLVTVGVLVAFLPASTAPFADAKLVVLLLGTLLIARSGLHADRTLTIVTGLWLGAVTLATAFSVDPYWSLMGAENQGVGLLVFVACGVLLLAGSTVPEELAARIPGWLVGAGLVIAAVAVLQRFVPISIGTFDLGARGSLLGQPVALGAVMAVAVIAAAATMGPSPRLVASLVVLGSGLSLSANRGGWIGIIIGLVIVFVRSRSGVRSVTFVVLPLVGTFLLWAGVEASGLVPDRVSPVRGFARVLEGTSDRSRLYAWSAYLRGAAERPVLGWGPATGWGAFLSSGTPSEFRGAVNRGWGDPHNVAVESLTTTGVTGFLALLSLLGTVLLRGFRAPPARSWALGAVAALGGYHLLQPLSVPLTPLAFLLAGLLVTGPAVHRVRCSGRWLVLPVALLLVLSLVRLGASTAEQYGRTYASEAALRTSLTLEPLRLSARHALALHLAVDAHSRIPGAAAGARSIARTAVEQHSWHPGVRLTAASVESMLEDHVRAERWVREHLRIFPNDPTALLAAARLALERGDRGSAVELARRAEDVRPSRAARRIIRQAEATNAPGT